MPFVYSEQYYADIGYHVFPMEKYRLVYRRLQAHGLPMEVVTPEPATREQLLSVHTSAYLDDLQECRLTARTAYSELPITSEIITLFQLACGGTILACRQAVDQGWSVHIGGGFHHAFADRAEGFCYLNDLAVATRVMQAEHRVRRVAIIDCDVHQGNGTARIFKDDDSVFTFSIHQRDLYPIKEQSDLDIHLPNHVADDDYLAYLAQAMPKILRDFSPELVLYQAGADPYKYDQLGSLSLTIDGLRRRDRYVLEQCQRAGVPVAVTLGGGYAANTDDTVQIHVNTCLEASEVLSLSKG